MPCERSCGKPNDNREVLYNDQFEVTIPVQKSFAPQNIRKKLPSKIAHNPPTPTVFNPKSFCFVQQLFHSLKFSHL